MPSIRQFMWAVVALAISVIIAYCALSLVPEESAAIAEPPPSKWDADINRLTQEALDEAYRNQLVHLFSVWMKDDTGQPARAVNGARQARHAYISVMVEIEKRENK
jgi:hypothetical protein